MKHASNSALDLYGVFVSTEMEIRQLQRNERWRRYFNGKREIYEVKLNIPYFISKLNTIN